ncbi:hypothetical protein JK358_38630 [Nocardia sp. 2]|uniref:Uncharacterized protein n=1 Tax=Nocardia acididurans TaxID=2802282 RepID=A0ABS1MJ27_9NOCA|nr:hypothetical protein [Nocardia acididurans]MBL1080329.1 hypothetical protein [Nocardia acididurans]
MKARQILATVLLAGAVAGGGVAAASTVSAAAISNNPSNIDSAISFEDAPSFWPRW